VEQEGGVMVMRDIKFRAWHKIAKFMFEVNALSKTAVEELLGNTSYTYDRRDVALMQFTGLNDKTARGRGTGCIGLGWSRGS
jgi:hypothetical protein